jgi:hypothetical protein
MRTRNRIRAGVGVFAAALLTASATGCAPLNALDDVMLPGSSMSTLTGEVRSVDTRRGRIQVREEYGNRRTHTVRVDNRTRINDGQRRSSLSSLRRGDEVRVRLSHDRSGNAWAERIDVRRSQRSTASNRTTRIDGVVRQVDTRRGYFTVEQSRSQSITVYVQRVSSSDARRFDRLRRGDRVRAEVRLSGRDRAELVRFR